MQIDRYVLPAQLVLGAALIAALAGCGGSSSASTANASADSPAASRRAALLVAPRRPVTSPQLAVQTYVKGMQTANGTILCNVLSESLRQAIIEKIVAGRPANKPEAPCAQALAGLAAAITKPGERHFKLPPLHVTTTGNRAEVRYLTVRSHKPEVFVLAKLGSGWLIEEINGIS